MSQKRSLILSVVAVLGLAISLLANARTNALPADALPADTLPPGAADTRPTSGSVEAMTPPLPAAVVQVSGQIDDYVRDQVKVRIERAKAAGAKVIILEIDTYGGLVSSGLDISRFLKNQTDVKIIALVNSKAISAGAMIALACDEIVMTPSATLGDCAPIQIDQSTGQMVPMGESERQKQESPVLSDFRESARSNGHDPLLAVAMVSLPYTVYWVENADGVRKFVDAGEYKTLIDSGDWKPVAGEANPIDGPGTLLTVHTEQALRYGLARGTATSADDLARQANLTVIERYEDGAGSQLIALLGSPATRMLLIIVFINALFIGLKTPGTGAAEAIAVVSLGILVGIPLLTGYAEWGEIIMILAGIALIAVEIFVFPGAFVGLIVGGLLLLGGIMLTFVGDVWEIPGGWSMPKSWDGLQTGIQVTVIGLACSILLFSWLRMYLPKLPYLRSLILTTAAGGSDDTQERVGSAAATGEAEDRWPFVGTFGTAVSDLKPGGTARFPYADDSRVASVVSIDGYVPAGAKLIVREVHGNNVVVRVVKQS